ncbi:MAG: hypothetical protein II672_01180 [Oscillospiraceae bacterium]|nr:hypothetical protein [Oscillospiraceae bacterium]
MNYDHPQLDPSIRRFRAPNPLPQDPPSPPYPDADKMDPYRNVYIGLFDTPFRDEADNVRNMICYIPSTEKSAWNMVLVFIPGKEDPKDFFEKGNWKDTCEKNSMTAFFLPAPDGWRNDDPGFELETGVRALAEMRSNRYFQSNAPAVYCLGFGDGAAPAALFAVTHCETLAAWGAWGDTALDDLILERLGSGPSDSVPEIPRSKVHIPCVIIDDNESNTVRYFKTANNVKDEHLRNDFCRVFRQQPKPGESFLNDHACSEVWHGTCADAESYGYANVIDEMVTFISGYKRWAGYTISDLRKTEDPEALGMIRTEMVIGGWKRHWWTFEPTDYKLGKKKKYPLVVAIHGFTCSGEFFANNADWHYVGEQRGAIIVYPTATPFTGSPDGPRPPHFTTQQWNCGLESNLTDPAGPDELEYFRILLEETKKNYPIDPERIYVTGHSNGGMMTQYLMRYMPAEFAGFAPVGFMEDRNHDMRPEPDDGIARNIWFTMGEFDLTGMELKEGNANYGTVRKLCEHNGLNIEDSRTYVSGNFVHTVWRDENKVPMVRFTGVVNWPHTYSPEVAFLIYDEFFSRFVRHSDGTLEYLA